jgi:hypothetical protein
MQRMSRKLLREQPERLQNLLDPEGNIEREILSLLVEAMDCLSTLREVAANQQDQIAALQHHFDTRPAAGEVRQ